MVRLTSPLCMLVPLDKKKCSYLFYPYSKPSIGIFLLVMYLTNSLFLMGQTRKNTILAKKETFQIDQTF